MSRIRSVQSAILTAMVIGVAFSGCIGGSDNSGPPSESEPPAEPTLSPTSGAEIDSPRSDFAEQLRTLVKSSTSGLEDQERLVIEDDAGWSSIWSRHASIWEPPLEQPRVDFTRDRVVVVALGDRPSGCWAIDVTEVTTNLTMGTTVAEVTTRAPGPAERCPAAHVQPVHFVVISARDTSLLFVEDQPSSGG